MANITIPANIPTTLRDEIAEVVCSIGPYMLPGQWPQGLTPQNITNNQLATAFEHITRKFWMDHIREVLAERAAFEARQQTNSQYEADRFEPGATPSL